MMFLRVIKNALLLPFVLALSTQVFAVQSDEIKHLLAYVEATDCQYERNGKHHNGSEALAHIRKKYDYYQDDIQSAEDFIKYAATKSNLSGKHYKVHCDNQKAIKSSDWLKAELSAFRKAQN